MEQTAVPVRQTTLNQRLMLDKGQPAIFLKELSYGPLNPPFFDVPLIQVDIDTAEALSTLHHLLGTVSPIALRPVDILLKALFLVPCPLVSINLLSICPSVCL